MPAHKRTKKATHVTKRLRKRYDNQHKDHKRLVENLSELLGIACKYCNNLENHLKSKGYSLKMVEQIKDSAPVISTQAAH